MGDVFVHPIITFFFSSVCMEHNRLMREVEMLMQIIGP